MRTIHRFWGGKPMPERYREYGRKWMAMNPGWDVVDWDLPMLVKSFDPVSAPVIRHLMTRDPGRVSEEFWVQLADVVGYELLYQYGGVYLNCDIEPVRALECLGDAVLMHVWASYENRVDGRIVNAAMGSPWPRHPFYAKLLLEATRRYLADPHAEMVQTTGPAMLTDMVAEWNVHSAVHPPGGRVVVLPVEAFNPVHWRDVPQGGWVRLEGTFTDATIGVHHWGHRLTGRSNTVPS